MGKKPTRMYLMKSAKVVQSYLEGHKTNDILQNSGIGKSTLYRILDSELGQGMLQKAYVDSIDQLTYALPNLVKEAIGYLESAVTTPHKANAASVMAAQLILYRLDKVEALLEKSQMNPTVQGSTFIKEI